MKAAGADQKIYVSGMDWEPSVAIERSEESRRSGTAHQRIQPYGPNRRFTSKKAIVIQGTRCNLTVPGTFHYQCEIWDEGWGCSSVSEHGIKETPCWTQSVLLS